jgi:hypothetical protein
MRESFFRLTDLVSEIEIVYHDPEGHTLSRVVVPKSAQSAQAALNALRVAKDLLLAEAP